MADGHHVGKYWKRHNSPTNGPSVSQLGWSHPIMFPILDMLYNSSYDGTDWDDSWVVASKQRLCCKTGPFPWYWSLLLTVQ